MVSPGFVFNPEKDYLFVSVVETILITLRFKYTTKFSLPKIACPAIVYAEIVVVIDPFFVGACPLIKVYRYNPTEISTKTARRAKCGTETLLVGTQLYSSIRVHNKHTYQSLACEIAINAECP